VYIFAGEILRDTFCDLLCSFSTALLTQFKEGLGENVDVTVEDAKDKRILRLELRLQRRHHGACDSGAP
jgi:hypothetical protein